MDAETRSEPIKKGALVDVVEEQEAPASGKQTPWRTLQGVILCTRACVSVYVCVYFILLNINVRN